MTTFPQRASKNPKLPHDMRIRPSAKNIIPSELKHDATLTADINVNRFGKRLWAELSAQKTSKQKHSPHDVRICPSAKNIIAGELKHDAALAADIDVNRFGKRFWAELSAQQTSRNPKLPHDVCIRPSA
jgi:hypothetical protein